MSLSPTGSAPNFGRRSHNSSRRNSLTLVVPTRGLQFALNVVHAGGHRRLPAGGGPGDFSDAGRRGDVPGCARLRRGCRVPPPAPPVRPWVRGSLTPVKDFVAWACIVRPRRPVFPRVSSHVASAGMFRGRRTLGSPRRHGRVLATSRRHDAFMSAAFAVHTVSRTSGGVHRSQVHVKQFWRRSLSDGRRETMHSLPPLRSAHVGLHGYSPASTLLSSPTPAGRIPRDV
jgi:hypothetical protein